MKKIISVMLAILLIISFSSCSMNNSTSEYESQIPEIYREQVNISGEKAIKIAKKYAGDVEKYDVEEYKYNGNISCNFMLFPDFSDDYKFEQFGVAIPNFCWQVIFEFGNIDLPDGWRIVYVSAVDGALVGTERVLAD
jgi:uncharacterized protein YxeA